MGEHPFEMQFVANSDQTTVLVQQIGFTEVPPLVSDLMPEEGRPVYGLGVVGAIPCPDPDHRLHTEHLALMMPWSGAAGVHAMLLAFRDSLSPEMRRAYDDEVQQMQGVARQTRETLLDTARRLRTGE